MTGRRPPGRQAAAGSGCGVAVLLLAAVPLALAWIVLGWAGAGVPTLPAVAAGPPGGGGWLVLSTAAALAVLLAAAPLIVVMLLTDSVPNPAPRRLHLAWLLVILPGFVVVAILAAWLSFAVGQPGAARALAVVPWVAGPALALTAGIVYSSLDR